MTDEQGSPAEYQWGVRDTADGAVFVVPDEETARRIAHVNDIEAVCRPVGEWGRVDG